MNLTTQQADIVNKLQDFDTYMEKLLEDWNAPGVGVGIVAEDKLVFAQGYGDWAYAQPSDRNYQELSWRTDRLKP